MVELGVPQTSEWKIPHSLHSAKWYQRIERTVRKYTESLPKKISIALIDDDEMRSINKRTRKCDKVTDVLSFLYEDGEGEILICIPQALRQYKRFKSASVIAEVQRLVIHGMLHVSGFDHKTPSQARCMFGIAKIILKELS